MKADLIERLTRCLQLFKDARDRDQLGMATDELCRFLHEEDDAIAALQAAPPREPTNRMMNEGAVEWQGRNGYPDQSIQYLCKRIWQRMLDTWNDSADWERKSSAAPPVAPQEPK